MGCKEAPRNNKQLIQQKTTMTKRIKISELKSQLKNLENGQSEFDYIGITSNGNDCIYFTYDNHNFNIEFEAIVKNQVPFLDKLKEFAKFRNIETKITTYNNKAQYETPNPAPVLRIKKKYEY